VVCTLVIDFCSVIISFVTATHPPLFPYTTLFRSSAITSVSSIVGTVTRVAVAIFTAPIILFYMLRDGHKLPTYFAQFLPIKIRRSEEHTSELQSRFDLVCRLLLEKKKFKTCMSCD